MAGADINEEAAETDPLLRPNSASRMASRPNREAALADICTMGLSDWLKRLSGQFGWRLLALIFVLLHLLNGFARNLVGPAGAMPYLFRSYQLPAPDVLVYNSVLHSIWVVAPLFALLTDLLPLGGYRKSPYIIITSVLGTVGCLLIFAEPELSAKGSLICLVLLQFQQVAATVCCTGTYVQRLQGQEEYGADLQTYVSFGIEAAGLLGNIVTGPIVQGMGPRAAWGVAALPAAAVGSLTVSGYFEERAVDGAETRRTRQAACAQPVVVMLSLILFACMIFTNTLTLRYASLFANISGYLIAVSVVVVFFGISLNPKIAQVAIFSVLWNMLSINVDSALFYFLTDTDKMLKEGPHLSIVFYNSVRGPVYGLFALVGIYTYNRYMKGWNYRKVIVVSNAASAATTLASLIIVTRLNVRMGIPDTVFVLILAACRSMTLQWTRMPFRVLFMYLCPLGMEATMYSLLKGTSDLGNSASDSLGAFLLDYLRCRPSGTLAEDAAFENLPMAIIVTACCGLFAALLLIPLIPGAPPNCRLAGKDAEVAQNSLLSRLFETSPTPVAGKLLQDSQKPRTYGVLDQQGRTSLEDGLK